MSEKGGEKAKTPESTIDLRIILTSIITVCIGFIVVAGIMYAGVQIGRNYEASLTADDTPIDDVTDIIGIQYETKAFTYNPGIKEGAGTESEYRELLKKVGGEENYYYIGSNDAYDKVIYDNEIQFFWDNFNVGSSTVSFTFRATRRGIYPTPPVQAECMYEPEIFGRSDGYLVEIK